MTEAQGAQLIEAARIIAGLGLYAIPVLVYCWLLLASILLVLVYIAGVVSVK